MDSHFRPQLYSASAFVMLRYLSFAPFEILGSVSLSRTSITSGSFDHKGQLSGYDLRSHTARYLSSLSLLDLVCSKMV